MVRVTRSVRCGAVSAASKTSPHFGMKDRGYPYCSYSYGCLQSNHPPPLHGRGAQAAEALPISVRPN